MIHLVNSKEKILLKLRGSSSKSEWQHLCYVDKALYDNYVIATQKAMSDMGETISRWCKQDFNVDIKLDTRTDVETLRNIVKNQYKALYPDIYQDSTTDRQGWMRIWVTKNIKEELSHGRTCV